MVLYYKKLKTIEFKGGNVLNSMNKIKSYAEEAARNTSIVVRERDVERVLAAIMLSSNFGR